MVAGGMSEGKTSVWVGGGGFVASWIASRGLPCLAVLHPRGLNQQANASCTFYVFVLRWWARIL